MSRSPRIHVPGGIYHVILRGNAREPIFFSVKDRLVLNEIVAGSLARHQCQLHAFCWMTNHVHAVIRVSDLPLGESVRWIATQYACYLNRRRGRTGHVFERRHHAILVEKEEYLFELVRYIHLNPVRAGIVGKPEDFRWSSHRAYIGRQQLRWLSSVAILRHFDDSLPSARAAFRRFVGEHDPADAIDGPVRLDLFVKTYCATEGFSVAELRGPSRERSLVQARVEIAREAELRKIAGKQDVARYFRRSRQAINRAVARYDRSNMAVKPTGRKVDKGDRYQVDNKLTKVTGT